ncbi:OmpA family protein [Photobacterium sp. ZSDE20]|uniref:OmpA family protein n=1 Tax=Photobacterium pectinilyticum TaxID=2906793 RepID=A0ABT1N1F8_9GAMM|nr:OmpA family protein [Photobacterium sp. ZSDE20]MCQ1057957.1 OmpA family protein [Photobacterium sp. ZSDE20]MDD1822489.1 OmpA family protein [Photobacterium sp. ZSDE20]
MNIRIIFSALTMSVLAGCMTTQQPLEYKNEVNDIEVENNRNDSIEYITKEEMVFVEESFVTTEIIDQHLNLIEPGRYFSKESENRSYMIFDSQETNKRTVDDYQGLVASYNSVNSSGFAVNSATLSTKIKLHLDSIKNAYENYRKFEGGKTFIIITGHTDSSGSWNYNKQLSRSRSDSAARYLMEAGVPNDSILRIAAGEDFPIAPNDNKANMAKNRRVEFFITQDTSFVNEFYRSAPCYTERCQTRTIQAVAYTREGRVVTEARHIPKELQEKRALDSSELKETRELPKKEIRYRKMVLPTSNRKMP